MLTCITNIYIVQQPNKTFPNRTASFFFDFACEWEAADDWEDFTNQAKVTLPKNIYYTDRNGNKINLGNTLTGIGGFNGTPSFMRGDTIQIISGYEYFSNGNKVIDTATIFSGYISKVSSKKPFVLECEDNMWLLKQAPAKGGVNGVFSFKKYNAEDILRELISNAGLSFTVNPLTSTNLGVDFRVDNGTIGQVLEKMRKEHYLKSYFRGNELRCGSEVYIESEAKTQTFVFQENIIEDDLEYNRKDDLVLSAIASSTNKVDKTITTKDGHTKTKTEKLEVLVTYQNGEFFSMIKTPTSKIPDASEGERHEFFFNNITDPQKLITEAQNQLKKYYYTGFKGNFTTFIVPFVKQGDNALIQDQVLPERNGTYKIKGVKYKGGTEGLRQIVSLDFKFNI